ncbi:SART-1 family protein [Ostertagia ostertagi]
MFSDCMGTSSRHSKKRRGDDEDSDGGRRNRERNHSSSRSRSPSPKPKKSRRREKEKESSPPPKDDVAESLSIEETNKLRAKLGLAPLEMNDGPKPRESEDGTTVHVEDGFEFRHKKPENWSDKKREQEMKEKLEIAKKKRQVYERVLVAKSIAESDSDDDAADWVAKMRKQEEEKKRAEERAKMLDAMDEEFGVNSIIAEEKAKQAKKKARQQAKGEAKNSYTGGLVVGHSKEAFIGVSDQILVLDDKSVLDDGEEVLVNPNLIENERYARNRELKRRKELQKGFDDVDEFGNQKSYGVLTKYDEELEGVQKEKFRLDEAGGYDLEKEMKARMRRELEIAGKTLVSMEMQKYQVGSEFCMAKEEMTAFRKVKKGKKEKSTRKRKILKAEDLVPEEPANGKDLGSRKSRRRDEGNDEEQGQDEVKSENVEENKNGVEEHDMAEPSGHWKRATKNGVDIDMLKSLVDKDDTDVEDSDEEMGGAVDLSTVVVDDDAEEELASVMDKARRLRQVVVKKEDDDVAQKVLEMVSSHNIKMEVDDDTDVTQSSALRDGAVTLDSTMEYCRNIEEMGGAVDLSTVVVDDDAEEELASVMDKARRLRQVVVKKEDDDVAQKVLEMVSSHNIKMEVDDDTDVTQSSALRDGAVTLDSTMEYCRNIGEIPTYGLAGNRTDAIDVSEMKQEDEEEDTAEIRKWKQAQAEKELRRKERLMHKEGKSKWNDKPSSSAAAIDSDDEQCLKEAEEAAFSDDEDSNSGDGKKEYENVLGKEADVTKGVGAMLKLAAQKGYLNDPEAKKKTGQNLDHLRNQSKTQIEQGKYDIEDKYAKKLDRLGTTGRGPIMPFNEKKDYRPEVNIHYVDEKGRVMDQEEAYRELSFK